MKSLKLLAAVSLVLLATSCGKIDQYEAKLTGKAESCIDGVVYIQFASGVTVKYLPNGNIATCK